MCGRYEFVNRASWRRCCRPTVPRSTASGHPQHSTKWHEHHRTGASITHLNTTKGYACPAAGGFAYRFALLLVHSTLATLQRLAPAASLPLFVACLCTTLSGYCSDAAFCSCNFPRRLSLRAMAALVQASCRTASLGLAAHHSSAWASPLWERLWRLVRSPADRSWTLLLFRWPARHELMLCRWLSARVHCACGPCTNTVVTTGTYGWSRRCA